MKTSLVIPSYITTPELAMMAGDCLDSLKYGQPDELIIVDDGSPLDLDYEEFVPGAKVIRLPENRGYTEAINAGLPEATGDVIIIGNNDITFTPGWVEAILLPIEQGYDVSSIVTSDQGYIVEPKITEDNRFGSLWAMKREVYDRVGLFDRLVGRQFFTDTDYYLRIKNAGYRIAKNWGHLVEHRGSATYKANPGLSDFDQSQESFKKKWGFVI